MFNNFMDFIVGFAQIEGTESYIFDYGGREELVICILEKESNLFAHFSKIDLHSPCFSKGRDTAPHRLEKPYHDVKEFGLPASVWPYKANPAPFLPELKTKLIKEHGSPYIGEAYSLKFYNNFVGIHCITTSPAMNNKEIIPKSQSDA